MLHIDELVGASVDSVTEVSAPGDAHNLIIFLEGVSLDCLSPLSKVVPSAERNRTTK